MVGFGGGDITEGAWDIGAPDDNVSGFELVCGDPCIDERLDGKIGVDDEDVSDL